MTRNTIGWISASIDRPTGEFARASAFWSAITATRPVEVEGHEDQRATLVPEFGDAFLGIEARPIGPGTSRPTLHVDFTETSVNRAIELGATQSSESAESVRLISPAGISFQIQDHNGESTRPTWVDSPTARSRSVVDQLSLDVGATSFEIECHFWAQLLGAEVHLSTIRGEFGLLQRIKGLPLRLMLQRLDDPAADPMCHLDLSCDDRAATAVFHCTLGAKVIENFEYWIVMEDPTGIQYCLTHRSPDVSFQDELQ